MSHFSRYTCLRQCSHISWHTCQCHISADTPACDNVVTSARAAKPSRRKTVSTQHAHPILTPRREESGVVESKEETGGGRRREMERRSRKEVRERRRGKLEGKGMENQNERFYTWAAQIENTSWILYLIGRYSPLDYTTASTLERLNCWLLSNSIYFLLCSLLFCFLQFYELD